MTWDIETSSLVIMVYVMKGASPDNGDRPLFEFQCCTYSEDGWVEYNPNHKPAFKKPIRQFSDRYEVIKEIQRRAAAAKAETRPDII